MVKGNRIKFCKECGKELAENRLILYCRDCLGKKKQKEMKEFYGKNNNWRERMKWREKLTLVKAKVPCAEDWNNGYIPAITKTHCSYCKEIHYEDKVYYHPFMKTVFVFGLTLDDIEELLESCKTEIIDGKLIIDIMQDKGLNRKDLINEELDLEEKSVEK